MNISIKDIARKARVSPSTVSRVMNNSAKIGQKTRVRVLRIVKKYNYQPNLAARSLIKGTSDLLTLILPDSSDFYSFVSGFYFRQILYGISDVMSHHQYRLMVYQPKGYHPEFGYPASLDGIQTAGIFVIAPLLQDRMVKYLEIHNHNAVLINGRSPHLDWVDMDNVKASVQIVEHLVHLGHRRIAFVMGMSKGFNAVDRMEGFRQGLSKFKIPYNPDYVLGGKDYSFESGYAAAKQLMGMKNPPTAIYATSDILASGAIRAVGELGLTVPNYISVFGFDDTDAATLTQPPLCTYRQPLYAYGKAAAETLIARIQNPKSPQKTVLFEGEMILRQSCSPLSNAPAKRKK